MSRQARRGRCLKQGLSTAWVLLLPPSAYLVTWRANATGTHKGEVKRLCGEDEDDRQVGGWLLLGSHFSDMEPHGWKIRSAASPGRPHLGLGPWGQAEVGISQDVLTLGVPECSSSSYWLGLA